MKNLQKRKERFQTKVKSSIENQKKLSVTIKKIEDEMEIKKSDVEKVKSDLEYYQNNLEEIEDDVKILTEGFHDKRVKRALN